MLLMNFINWLRLSGYCIIVIHLRRSQRCHSKHVAQQDSIRETFVAKYFFGDFLDVSISESNLLALARDLFFVIVLDDLAEFIDGVLDLALEGI